MEHNISFGKGQGLIKYNIDNLLSIKKELEKKYKTRVGVLGSKTERTDGSLKKSSITNAKIGKGHEFGLPENKLPKRSWLRVPIFLHLKDHNGYLKKEFLKSLEKLNIREFYLKLGIVAEKVIQEGFDTGGYGEWPPLSLKRLYKKHPKGFGKFTKKHNDQILIDTGQLRKSVSSDVVKKW